MQDDAGIIPFPTGPRPPRRRRRPVSSSRANTAPRAPSPPPSAEPTLRYAAGHPGRGEDDITGVELGGVHVMVVEADVVAREPLVTALQQWGARVSSFASPAEAARELDLAVPDAVIIAIRIPGDPYQLIVRLRRCDAARGRHTPLLAVVDDTLDRRRASSAGIHLHVPRPVERGRLRLALMNLVRDAA